MVVKFILSMKINFEIGKLWELENSIKAHLFSNARSRFSTSDRLGVAFFLTDLRARCTKEGCFSPVSAPLDQLVGLLDVYLPQIRAWQRCERELRYTSVTQPQTVGPREV